MLVGLTGACSRGVEHRRRDAVAVRHRIGRRRAPAAAVGAQVDALHDRRRIVARADHQRHPQREFVAGLLHRLLIFDLHQHGFAGADIGDRVGEDVRPLLLGQRGLLAVRAGLLVDDAGLLPLLDVADDDAVADHHLERVDRAARRQRIDVGRLDPVLGRVAEDLRDAGADRRAGHREVDVDAEPGRVGVAVIGLQQQRAGARVARSDEGRPAGLPPTTPARSSQNKAANPTRMTATPCTRKNSSSSQRCATGSIGLSVSNLVAGGHLVRSRRDVSIVAPSCAERPRRGASRMIGIVQPPAGSARRAR